MKRERLTRARPHSSRLQCSLLIFSVFNELQRVAEKRATDGSPFETCCLCEVLGWSPEQKSMFMTYYKHTHIQCSVLPFKLQQGLIPRHTHMLKRGFRRCHTSAVILTFMLGIVVFCRLCLIFFPLYVYCTQTCSEKAKSRGRTKQNSIGTPFVLFKVVSINFTHSAVSYPEPCWLGFDLAGAVFYS